MPVLLPSCLSLSNVAQKIERGWTVYYNPPICSGAQKQSLGHEGQLLYRGDASRRHVGAPVVICPGPAGGKLLRLGNGCNQVLPHPVTAHGPFVALDIGILLGPAWLGCTPGVCGLDPFAQHVADVLRAVTQPD